MQANDVYAIRRVLGGRAIIYPNLNMTEEEFDNLKKRNKLGEVLKGVPHNSNFWDPNTCLVIDTLSERFSTIDEILASVPKPPQKEEK